MHSRFVYCFALVLLSGCQKSAPAGSQPGATRAEASQGSAAAAQASAARSTPEPATKLYGSKIQGSQEVSIRAILDTPESFQAGPVVVRAEVRRACSRKGCWMELAESEDAKAGGFRVTFKDYGFFVPTDSPGAHARVEGTVQITSVTAARVQHLEEEGATFTHKNSDGSAREVQLVATGVELWRS